MDFNLGMPYSNSFILDLHSFKSVKLDLRPGVIKRGNPWYVSQSNWVNIWQVEVIPLAAHTLWLHMDTHPLAECASSTFDWEEGARQHTNCTCVMTMVGSQPTSRGPMSGVVALVDVGSERRALPLRAALTALGASVVAGWSPLVTHLVWAQDGNPKTRALARSLAAHVVSPLWVEASAATARRECERSFPTAARRSDLPSPQTLIRLLEKAEKENVPLVQLLSHRKNKDSPESPAEEVRVNTAPRRALPLSVSPSAAIPQRSRRKLFVQKEPASASSSSSSPTPPRRKPAPPTPPRRRPVTSQPRRCLATSQPRDPTTSQPHRSIATSQTRIATSQTRRGPLTPRHCKGLARAERRARRLVGFDTQATQADRKPTVIVLTALQRNERTALWSVIKCLGGKVATKVTKSTSHVLVGPLLAEDESSVCTIRTLNALLGAVRGCRVLKAHYALDSFHANKWLHHLGYEVAYLKNVTERARVEREALGRFGREYFYDIFCGTKIRVEATVAHAHEAKLLLSRCGAICNSENNDITIGEGKGQVISKWVFDSVMTGRMRNTRSYTC